MGIKAPSFMTGLASAANTFTQSIKKVGVGVYNGQDRLAAKSPLTTAVMGLASMFAGSLASAVFPMLFPAMLPVIAFGGLSLALGLKHLFNPAKSSEYVPLDQESNNSLEHAHQGVPG